MSLPRFTADHSLYRSGNSYHSYGAEQDLAISLQSVVPTLTFEDTANCSRCENKCNEQSAECVGTAVAAWMIGLVGCAFSGPFYPICASGVSAAYATAVGVCTAKLAACHAVCNLPGESCCPQFCELGHCCSRGETCMPNGCCPSDRQVCGAECCPQGASCCDGACCGPEEHCCGNACCPANVPCGTDGLCAGFTTTPPPPPPANNCIFGGAPCGPKCCPPGLQCCSYSPEFGADCKTSCLH